MIAKVQEWVTRTSSLRRRTEKLVNQAIPKSGNYRSWVFNVLLSGFSSLFPCFSFLPWYNFNGIDSGTAIAWMAGIITVIAAVFGIIIAISAFVVGIDLPGEERENLIRNYMKQCFTAVFMQGLILLLCSITVMTLNLVYRPIDQSLVNARIIIATVLGLIILSLQLVDLLYFTMRTLFNAHLLKTQQKRLINETSSVLRELSIQKVSQNLIKEFVDPKRLFYWDHALPPGGNRTVSPVKTGVISDINLNKLNRWMQSLEKFEEPEKRAALGPLRLGKFIGGGDWLVTLNDSNSNRDDLLRKSIIITQDRPDYSFTNLRDTLSVLSSDAVEHIQSNKNREFSDLLDVLYAFYEIILKTSNKILSICKIELRSDLVLVSSWTENLHTINGAAAVTDRNRFASKWMEFIFKLISLSKEERDNYSIHNFYSVFGGFVIAVTAEKLQIATTYLINYTWNLVSEFSNASLKEDIETLAFQILIQINGFVPRLVVSLPPNEFYLVEQWSETVSSIQNADCNNIAKQNAISDITRSRIQLWLGYGGWLIKKYHLNKINADVIKQRIQYLISQCGTLHDLWVAFSHFSTSGMLWSTMDNFVEEETQNPHDTKFSFIDQYAGSQWFFVIAGALLINRLIESSIPPDENAWGILNFTLKPVFEDINKNVEEWSKLTRLPLDTFKMLINRLSEQVRFSAHKGEILTYIKVKSTPLDNIKVSNFIGILWHRSVGSLQIFEKLKQEGCVNEISGLESEMQLFINTYLPKESFIASKDYIELVSNGPTVYDIEDLYLLHFVEDHDSVLANSPQSILELIRNALSSLENRGTPATVILCPFDWRIWETIRTADEYSQDKENVCLGTFSKIPMFYFPRLWGDKKRFIVASLESWLSVDTWLDAETHTRFLTILDVCTPEEISERIQDGYQKSSRIGEPFVGEDLITVAECELKYKVWDRITSFA